MEEIWIVETISEDDGSEFSYFTEEEKAETFVADCKADGYGGKVTYEITSEPVDL
jgi:hypothetical protein